MPEASKAAGSSGPRTDYLQYPSTDGASLNALLWPAPAGSNDTALILVPGFYGSFVGPNDYQPLAGRLNAAGHAFMAINMRTANDFTDPVVERAVEDIGGAVAELKKRGYRRIALFGTSLGAPRTLLYLEAVQDPAVVLCGLLAPITSPYEEAQLRMNEADRARLEDMLKTARGLVAKGEGKAVIAFENWFSYRSVRMTARGFLNVFGSRTDTSISSLNRAHKVRLPAIVIHGLADDISLPPIGQAVHDALTSAPSRELMWVEGGTHILQPGPVAEEYGKRIADWASPRLTGR